MALQMEMGLYVKRVPTKDNLADDPSRERYGLLHRINVSSSTHHTPAFSFQNTNLQATKVDPVMAAEFCNAQAWSSLCTTAHSQWLTEIPVEIDEIDSIIEVHLTSRVPKRL